MKNYLPLVFFLTISSVLLAQNKKEDPLQMTAEEIKTRGIQSIRCLHERNYSMDSIHNFSYKLREEHKYFDRSGHMMGHQKEDYQREELFSREEEKIRITYHRGQLQSTDSKTLTYQAAYQESMEYENGLLVHRQSKGGRRDKSLETSYTYLANGKIDQITTVFTYPRVEKFIYDGKQLNQIAFYFNEKDSLPTRLTHYYYQPQGLLQRIIQIDQAGDTLFQKNYDEAGRLIYHEAQRVNKHHYQAKDYVYKAFFSYDQRGRLTRKKYIPDLWGGFRDEDGTEVFDEVIYHYKNNQLIQKDSFHLHHYLSYTDFNALSSILSTPIGQTDTIFLETYTYNEEQKLTQLMVQDFHRGNGSQQINAYNAAGHHESITVLNFSVTKRKHSKYNYNSQNQLIKKEIYIKHPFQDTLPMILKSIYTYDYDANQQLTYRIKKNKSRDQWEVERSDSLAYQNGQLVQHNIFGVNDELKFGDYYNTYVYNEQDQLIQHIEVKHQQDTSINHLYDYDEQHKLTQSTLSRYRYSKDQKKMVLNNQSLITYNAQGRKVRNIYYNAKGDARSEQVYEYNDRGLLKVHHHYDGMAQDREERRKTYFYQYY